MAASELWRWDAVDLAHAIRLRKISSREAVDACLARLDAVNPKLNAVVQALPEQARAAADAADKAVKAGGELGPLHGVPLTIKENIDQAGLPTVNGVKAFLDVIAKEDSPVVSNWKKAGAIVIGRTNTPAFSLRYHTDNEPRGQTFNPWTRSRTPGGSSGGAGAALAAGIGPLAHGNDYGGSVRYPAYCCGVAGLRPTFGRVPAFNATAPGERTVPLQLMSVQGPLARHVRDLRVGLAAMAAHDARDPWWVPAPLQGPPVPRPIKVALARNIPGLKLDPAVDAALVKAGQALADAGYAVEEVAVPPLVEAGLLGFALITQDVRLFSLPQIQQMADAGGARAVTLYEQAVAPLDAKQYPAALAERSKFLRQWLLFFERYPLVVAPVSARLPMQPGFDQQDAAATHAMVTDQSPLVVFNLMGLPSLAVPVGLAQAADAPKGIPVGVQIVASRYREDLTLDAAEAIEARHGIATPIDPVG